MQTIQLNCETTVCYTVDIEISNKDYEKLENGELDDDDILEKYDEKIRKEQAKYDLNAGDCDTYFYID